MSRLYHVLLILGDTARSAGIATFLHNEGYHVTASSDGVAGLNLVRRAHSDLIILDADLPGIDGITLCGTIRKRMSTPIVLLINDGDELQHMIALDRGADVCMIKPVSLAELRARLRALLRRVERSATREAQPVAVGDVRLDIQRRRAWIGAVELRLTPKEFDLLAYLMQHCGLAVPRDQLLRAVWGDRVAPTSQTLDVHIRWLRKKVEPNPAQPTYIQTVRMVGYRLSIPNEPNG